MIENSSESEGLLDPVPSARHASLIEAEVQEITASRTFARSPTMVRLLQFLTKETLAGRGETLKSYTIAVDGLGRGPGFDPQADSYPRVQTVRLRRLLADFYATEGASREYRIQIPMGLYKVELVSMLTGRALSARHDQATHDGTIPDQGARATTAPSASLQVPPRSQSGQRALLAAALALCALAGAILLGLQPGWTQNSPAAQSAILLVSPITHNGDPAANSLARSAEALIMDGLSDSWVVRVRPASQAAQGDDLGYIYRLEAQLGPDYQGKRTLFTRLFDQRKAVLIWSQEFDVPTDPAKLHSAIDSVVARIGGSYGIIAKEETTRLGDTYLPGYACALQYFRFASSRDAKHLPHLQKCLNQPTEEGRLAQMMLGLKGMSALDFPGSSKDREARAAAALLSLEAAAHSQLDDPVLLFALARLAYAQQDCEKGGQYARLALEANDADPLPVGTLSVLMSFCGEPEGPQLADRAMQFHRDGDMTARLTTIFIAVVSRQRDRLELLARQPVPETADNEAYNQLANTMLFAALDRPRDAIASWARYKQVVGGAPNRSAKDLLGEFIPTQLARDQIVVFLKSKKVLPADAV